jgi:Rrf2 family transcriptional regulator, nitric oxide-sensitive transcriptional repressor
MYVCVMQLTTHSDYSLRVLIYLAVHRAELSTIEEIADAYRISRTHLMKVVQQLGVAGYVETLRGRGGGLRLAREPELIRVGDVVRHTEGNLALVECFASAESACRIERACGLRFALKEALESFFRTLDGYTIADLVAPRRARLARLLAS